MSYDFHVDATRSRTMSRIRSRDTGPEVVLRRALWAKGVRYRKNYRRIPGTPDIAIVRSRVAVFVDGTFWHGYDWENKKPRIKANATYWVPKIERTIARDRVVDEELLGLGWSVIRFWDTDVRRDLDACVCRVLSMLEAPGTRQD